MRLDRKRALITGASGEIGSEIARILHRNGCEVAISGRNSDALHQLASELKNKTHVINATLDSPKDAKALVSVALSKMSGIDILVNNAGITRDNLFIRMSDQDWNTVLTVNLSSAVAIMQGCVKQMIKQRWGRVINITSIVGITGNPGQANYAASKAGLVGTSKAVAREVASRGVTINCVAPGFIESPMTDKLNPEQKAKILDSIPMQSMGNSIDVASTVLFLALPESRYITGETINVNGGMAMI